MCPCRIHLFIPAFAVTVLIIGPPIGRAQTDASLLFLPWPEQRTLQLQGSAQLPNRGELRATDADFRLNIYDLQGRWRLMDEYPINPSIGYRAMLLDFDTDHPAVPDRAIDQSIGFGTPLGLIDDWFFATVAGIGYAGDRPFDDANAWYATALLAAGRVFEEDRILMLGLSYDGNRPIYPDLPIPFIVYRTRVSRDLNASIGFPFTGLIWTPRDEIEIDLVYSLPRTINVNASYILSRHWRIFASLQHRRNGFHVDGLPSNRRMFFRQTRAEIGARWQHARSLAALVAVGYAFNQRLDTGWDIRSTRRIAHPSDEPYLRFAIEWSY